jgi:cyclic pyranopterin phosphate synthase
MAELSHLDREGKARMVDVTDKTVSNRWAKARARLKVRPDLLDRMAANTLEKGDALTTAKIAGIQAAKKTAELIPLCHPISITFADVQLSLQAPDRVIIRSHIKAKDSTGVEMEALTAVTAAALTLYDMGKAVNRGMVIEEIKLVEKGGGRSGVWKVEDDEG